ncbi:hypothetical protein ACE6H2_020701 [Prunus campanulata]
MFDFACWVCLGAEHQLVSEATKWERRGIKWNMGLNYVSQRRVQSCNQAISMYKRHY